MTNIATTTTLTASVHSGGLLLKPLDLQFSVTIPQNVKAGDILKFAEMVQKSGVDESNAMILLPLWEYEAKKLGLTVNVTLIGSFFDPAKVLFHVIYWIIRKVLNHVGPDKYREMYKLN